MEPDLEELADRLRREDWDAYPPLVERLRLRPVPVLLHFMQSPDEHIRRAAVEAAAGRGENELVEVLSRLADDPADSVRAKLAWGCGMSPGWLVAALLERLAAYDLDAGVRAEAVRAARWRSDLHPALISRLGLDESWSVRQAIAQALAHAEPRLALPALVTALAMDADPDVQRGCATSAEKHLMALGGYPADLARPEVGLLALAREHLETCPQGGFPFLRSWLTERVTREVDLGQLAAFGTLLTVEAEAGRLPHGHGVEEACAAVRSVLLGAAPRAVVLLGDSGAGKTAVVHELAHQLLHDPAGPWHILQIAPAEFLAGTQFMGEWQTKLQNIVQAIRAPKRAILFVPNLQELSDVGRWARGDDNVASVLAPYIERGEVAIIGESTPEAFRKGLGLIGNLRRLFHTVEVREATAAQTRTILEAVRDEAAANVPEPVLDRLIELADFYLANIAQPGRSVGLLRRVLNAAAGRVGPVSERDVLTTLSTSTGIPTDILDDTVALDRASVRAFFESRIMGQPEAVDAVVDLVTLVKAGLTDPGKPFGVLFFIGPTGVGKTEMARSLAEYLFGDASRLQRLDMSEFAMHDAHERLLGWGQKPGLLTGPVRERPFSVVLLDEIEKAHFNVFDLCLQIFDAGRLTDMQGHTADFRRSILVLTSNIGSSISREAPVGFRATAPPPPDRETTLRELGRWFRPEFINRLDRIVYFRPLDAGTAEKIARREVAHMLERSGIARRKLAVDVEPAVLPLLLREGYSPAFGARPLKRTVERLVLLPVARAIAAGTVPAGSVVRLVARGGRVEVEVAPAETPDAAVPPPAARAVPVTERAAALVEHMAELARLAEPAAALKSELVARSGAADFWQDQGAARAVLDRIYRLDGTFAQLATLAAQVRDHAELASRHRDSERMLARIEERLAGLEGQARHVAFLLSCREPHELGDTFVILTRVGQHGTGLDGVGRLARMYMALAQRRGLEVQILDDRRGGEPVEDTLALLISGAGACALLAGEAGLHQLAQGRARGRGGKSRAADREVVRVEVLPFPTTPTTFTADEVRLEARPLPECQGRLLPRPRLDVLLLHTPSLVSVRVWTDGNKAQAWERLMPLLQARIEAARAAPAAAAHPVVVRRYNLGPAPLVRDLRTGLTTGRIDRIFEGHLDLFLHPPRLVQPSP